MMDSIADFFDPDMGAVAARAEIAGVVYSSLVYLDRETELAFGANLAAADAEVMRFQTVAFGGKIKRDMPLMIDGRQYKVIDVPRKEDDGQISFVAVRGVS